MRVYPTGCGPVTMQPAGRVPLLAPEGGRAGPPGDAPADPLFPEEGLCQLSHPEYLTVAQSLFTQGPVSESSPGGCRMTRGVTFCFHWCCVRSMLSHRQQGRLGSQERKKRSREKDDRFKGSLSEGMRAEQDESDEDV